MIRSFVRLPALLVLAALGALLIGVAPSANAGTTPVGGKYLTYAYISASRSGAAVYVNGLIKQDSAAGIIRSPHRTVYVQRNLAGAWQNMLARTTDLQGVFTVGFISVPNYQYRLVVLPTATQWGGTSAVVATTTPPPVIAYPNCASMHLTYPHGVGRPGAIDATSGARVTTFYVNAAIYNANTGLDRDKDGIACEQA